MAGSGPFLRVGVLAPVAADVTADPDWMARFASHVEACGFESIVVVEHTVVRSGYTSTYPYDSSGRMPLADTCPIPDPLNLLAYLAAVTERLVLSTGVLVLPNHHPVVLAKQAATVDVLSKGRLRLCVGIGWMREEIEACGVDAGSRARRMDEQIDVLRVLWGNDVACFSGEFFSFADLCSHPRPVHAGGVPVHIGGHSIAAARRAGRRGDGFYPLGLEGPVLQERLRLVRDEAEAAGRDPRAIEVTLRSTLAASRDEVEALVAQGADRVVVPAPHGEWPRLRDELSAFAARVIHGGA